MGLASRELFMNVWSSSLEFQREKSLRSLLSRFINHIIAWPQIAAKLIVNELRDSINSLIHLSLGILRLADRTQLKFFVFVLISIVVLSLRLDSWGFWQKRRERNAESLFVLSKAIFLFFICFSIKRANGTRGKSSISLFMTDFPMAIPTPIVVNNRRKEKKVSDFAQINVQPSVKRGVEEWDGGGPLSWNGHTHGMLRMFAWPRKLLRVF